MNEPLKRIRRGAVIFAILLALAVVGYRMTGLSWLDAVYMVVITISTVGYREIGDLGPAGKVFTIVVIAIGISTAGYVLGGFLQMMTEGEIHRALSSRRMTRGIDKLKDHVIICGFGRMGQILAEELHEKGLPCVVIDSDPERIADAESLNYLVVSGDAIEENALIDARVEGAQSLVTVLPNDAANVFITLTARNLNPGLKIIARGELETTRNKLIQAGADRVVLPAAIGAQRIANMITRPSTVELMELVAGRSKVDVEIDELAIPAGSPLNGKSIAAADVRRRHGLIVVAVKQKAGAMAFNPAPDHTFAAGDIAIVMGRIEDLERFRHDYRL